MKYDKQIRFFFGTRKLRKSNQEGFETMNINNCTRFLDYDEEQYLKRFGTVIRETIQGYNVNTLRNTQRTRYVFIHGDATLVIYMIGENKYFVKGYETKEYMEGYDPVERSECIGFTIGRLLEHYMDYLEVSGRLLEKENLQKSAREVLDMIHNKEFSEI